MTCQARHHERRSAWVWPAVALTLGCMAYDAAIRITDRRRGQGLLDHDPARGPRLRVLRLHVCHFP